MEWQPIATAPEDGSRVLMLSPDGMCIAYYDPFYPPRGAHPFSWVESISGELVCHCMAMPTHWMPLPEPPRAL